MAAYITVQLLSESKTSLPREGVFGHGTALKDVSEGQLLRYYRFRRPATAKDWDNRSSTGVPDDTLLPYPKDLLQVLLALRFYAGGSFQSVMAGAVSQGSVSRIMNSITIAIVTPVGGFHQARNDRPCSGENLTGRVSFPGHCFLRSIDENI